MTQPTTERDRIKERVAKLLNLTLDKGTSENEAIMAAEKAAELMAFYDIEASELSVRSARATKQTRAIKRIWFRAERVRIDSLAASEACKKCRGF